MDEGQLIIECQAGNVSSFETLVAPYMSRIINAAYAILQNREDAYDAAQESFLKAFKYIGKFNGRSSFYTWLFSICRNVCMDMLKAKKRRATVSLIYENEVGEEVGGIEQIADTAPSTEQIINTNETRKQIADAINQLSSDHRAVIILRELENMSYDDIAAVLKCPVGTVRSQINRARKKLQEILIRKGKLFD